MHLRAHPSFAIVSLLLVAMTLSIHLASASGPAVMVRDIQDVSYPINSSSLPGQVFATGQTAYYFGSDSSNGLELWKSTGTPTGTVLLKDINPGDSFSKMGGAPGNVIAFPFFTQIGSTVFFVANDGSHGSELWKTDGTTEGTTLVKDIWPGAEGANPYYLTAVGERLFFFANDGDHGAELWTSDGTEAGTSLLKDLWVGPFGDGYGLTNVNGTLFFFAFTDPAIAGMMLWKSDGTEAGTVALHRFSDSCGPLPFMAGANGLAYFAACATPFVDQKQLWRSDGTSEGTFPITAIPPAITYPPASVVEFTELVPFKNELYFSAGNKLWRTTGMTTTTTPIFDAAANQITPSGDQLFFAANRDGVGNELWVSDGSAQTIRVKDINPGNGSSDPYRFVPTSEGVRFSADDGTHGRELWASDGTAEGTVLVKDIRPGAEGSIPGATPSTYNGYSVDLAETITWGMLANGQTLFGANDGTHGFELWGSDGTHDGTTMLHDSIPELNDAFIRTPIDLNGTLIFSAYKDQVRGLWRNDDTGLGAIPLHPTAGMYTFPVVVSNTLFFGHANQLWRSDGTIPGTFSVAAMSDAYDYISMLTPLGNHLFFVADEALWRSDGTAAGTALVTRISPNQLTEANGLLYLTVRSWINGLIRYHVWRSDGTAAGTFAIKEMATEPKAFVAYDGSVFFTVIGAGTELWKTDGTAQGTVQVTTIPRSSYYGRNDTTPPDMQVVGNKLFFTALDVLHGNELWVSDGTAVGTHLVHDSYPGPGSSSPRHLTAVEGQVYFSAVSPKGGRELWRSDGTEAGTVEVADINPGIPGSNPTQLTPSATGLFFVASDPATGNELWRSDGTPNGTHLVQDINPGPTGAIADLLFGSGRSLTISGRQLFFQADDGVHGHELWSFALDDVAPPTQTHTSTPPVLSPTFTDVPQNTPTSETTITQTPTPPIVLSPTFTDVPQNTPTSETTITQTPTPPIPSAPTRTPDQGHYTDHTTVLLPIVRNGGEE